MDPLCLPQRRQGPKKTFVPCYQILAPAYTAGKSFETVNRELTAERPHA